MKSITSKKEKKIIFKKRKKKNTRVYIFELELKNYFKILEIERLFLSYLNEALFLINFIDTFSFCWMTFYIMNEYWVAYKAYCSEYECDYCLSSKVTLVCVFYSNFSIQFVQHVRHFRIFVCWFCLQKNLNKHLNREKITKAGHKI